MEWKTDILGNEFRQLTVNQGLDYDGPVRCTVVRYAKSPGKGRGVLKCDFATRRYFYYLFTNFYCVKIS